MIFFVLVFILRPLAEEFGASVEELTLTIVLTLAARPVGALIFGQLADRYGRRPILRLSREEVFGTVICIYPFSNLRESIAQANSLPFAFQAPVFSGDIDTALRAARSLDASTVLVNDHTAFRIDWMPFAGRRQSGYGVGGIPYTMHDMTQEKMIILRC